MERLMGSKPACETCVIMQYEIHRQMILSIKGGEIYRYHRMGVEYLSGKSLPDEAYPEARRLCVLYCYEPSEKSSGP